MRFRPGRLELLLLLAGLCYVLLRFTGTFLFLELLALTVVLILGFAVAFRVVRAAARGLLWRVRNRMIVIYLISAIIPAVLTITAVAYGARYLAGQVAVYLVHSELNRRVGLMEEVAQAVLRAPEERRQATLDRVTSLIEVQSPGTHVILDSAAAAAPDRSLSNWQTSRGVVLKDGLLYCWARVLDGGTAVTIVAPVTNLWLARLVPSLGDVTILMAAPGRTARTHGAANGDEVPEIPPAKNRFDAEVLWASKIPISIWDAPNQPETALLGVHSRMSAVLGQLFSLESESPLPLFFYIIGVALLVVEVTAFFLGVSLTRTITAAVHNLYEGTQRVMLGDFSHRIQVQGCEQVAELSRSFNSMTENLETLLKVAKEKERMEAELEIAREVQGKLFPRPLPQAAGLELHALCHPARSVSGDYYDYLDLAGGRLVIAVGDVAGKGISAALLMAMLQSSLRVQVREYTESAARNGADARLSTSRLISRLNQQVYEDTTPEKYATFFLAIYEEARSTLTYTNAGHLPPLLFRRGELIRADVNGLVVGAFPHAPYDESSIRLEPGDLLVCYTDGITEPENEFEEMFGEQRLIDVVLRMFDAPLEQIIAEVIAEVHKFTGSQELQDDMTLLIARRAA